MTDPTPTPTRAEVERFDLVNVAYDPGEYVKRIEQQEGGRFVRWSDYTDLRERAEAAEELLAHMMQVQRCTVDAANEARRAEAASWNDAIEAAADAVIGEGRMSADGNDLDPGLMVALHAIRALRRAAPTEGEA